MTPSHRTVVRGAAELAEEAAGSGGHDVHQAPADAGGFAADMHGTMQAMMRAMDVPMSGNPDRDFLAMMIPHHQGAVEMARLVLIHGRDPLTRQLAEEIVASQTAEIASMQARLRVLEAGETSGEFPALTGTRGR
jgi:uncharacterized protein (DUF305 family)